MNRQDFLQRLTEVLLADGEKIEDNTRLDSLPGWDSMGRVSLVALLDEEMNVQLPVGGLQNCHTVGDLVRLLGDKLNP